MGETGRLHHLQARVERGQPGEGAARVLELHVRLVRTRGRRLSSRGALLLYGLRGRGSCGRQRGKSAGAEVRVSLWRPR